MSAEYEVFREIIAHRKLAPQRERVTAMRQSGMAEDAIADEIGVSRTTVHYALAFWGIKLSKGQVNYRSNPRKEERRCAICEALLVDGVCPVCEMFAKAPDYDTVDDASFWGPLLPPAERQVREGAPLCEVLLGG